jgi:muramoyltetrapeptide carboxypeptidase
LGLNDSTIPPRVRAGDTVGLVSPSFGAIGAWPHRAERAISYLQSLELEVKLMPNAARNDGWASASPQERADDLHVAFSDDDVAVLLAAIGGNHSNQLLPYLDFELIGTHPKIFQGYSDMTVLHWAFLLEAGLSTFHGPALISQLGEYPNVLNYTDENLRAAWFGDQPLDFSPAAEWTEEFLDWDQQKDLERARELRPSNGWVTVRPGVAEGPLIGGCLESICWHLKGSSLWPDFAGTILILETSEEAPSVAHLDAYLTDLSQLGVFDAVAGLIVARPAYYSEEDANALWNVVESHTAAAGIPVLVNVDCGHTDPILTLPLGLPVVLDAGARVFRTTAPITR